MMSGSIKVKMKTREIMEYSAIATFVSVEPFITSAPSADL